MYLSIIFNTSILEIYLPTISPVCIFAIFPLSSTMFSISVLILSNKSSSINVANNHGGLWRWWNGYDLDDLQSDKRRLEAELRDTESTLSQYERDLEQVRREFTKDCQYFVNGVLQKL